jgi:hypothetical protein
VYILNAYSDNSLSGNISQISVKRDWMEQTYDRHAYNCFPVNLTNSLGWGISFPDDITFIWDGISDSSHEHVKILEGEKWCHPFRSNATISFKTGITIKTDEDVTTLVMPVPNQFIDGAQSFTTFLSTSFFIGEIQSAWRITKANVPITIKAGTPVCSIVPINLSKLNNSELHIKSLSEMPKLNFNGEEYGIESERISKTGNWTHFYRNATDHKGNVLGKHEIKTLRLKTINE